MLALLVLVPLLGTAAIVVSAATDAVASRQHALAAAEDASRLEEVANARAEMNRLEIPLTAISYAQQLGISEPELDALLHPSVSFRTQITQEVSSFARYPVFSSTPALRAEVAAIPSIIVSIAEGQASFDDVESFSATMASQIDDIWYGDYNQLQRDVSTWQPPESFEVHVATLRQTYEAFLSGGQEIATALYVLEGLGPADSKLQLIQASGEFQTATGEFVGQLGTGAQRAWRLLQTDPTDKHFAATIALAVHVSLDNLAPPFAGNLGFAAASAAPGLVYLSGLNRLVTAASSDLHATALAQASSATEHLVLQLLLVLLLTGVCVAGIAFTGRVLTKPLTRLANQAHRVGNGDFNLDGLPDKGPGEVATTIAAFNDMTSTLKAVEAKAVALASEDLSDPELLAVLPGRTGRALQLSLDALSARIREREMQRQLLHDAATHDGLTGLLNRPATFEYLTNAVGRRREAGETVAVLFVDLDGLKEFNDSYGHETGDSAILATALALKLAIGNCDVVGRLGGDEFLVVLCHEHSCEVDAAVRRIRDAVGECRIPVIDTMVPLEASVGIALTQCDADTDPMMLVHHADEAMYKAKKATRAARQGMDRFLLSDQRMRRAR